MRRLCRVALRGFGVLYAARPAIAPVASPQARMPTPNGAVSKFLHSLSMRSVALAACFAASVYPLQGEVSSAKREVPNRFAENVLNFERRLQGMPGVPAGAGGVGALLGCVRKRFRLAPGFYAFCACAFSARALFLRNVATTSASVMALMLASASRCTWL